MISEAVLEFLIFHFHTILAIHRPYCCEEGKFSNFLNQSTVNGTMVSNGIHISISMFSAYVVP